MFGALVTSEVKIFASLERYAHCVSVVALANMLFIYERLATSLTLPKPL
jgi:hypothetical protein